jgi:hypothetical protein
MTTQNNCNVDNSTLVWDVSFDKLVTYEDDVALPFICEVATTA